MSRHCRGMALVLAGALAACASREEAPSGVGGSFTLKREDGAMLFEAAAQGSHCAGESTIALVAVGGGWSAALAVRAGWPADSPLIVPVAPGPVRQGSASVAARQVRDSVEVALMGSAGRVRLEPGRVLAGDFEATVVSGSETGDSVRLVGSFRDVPVRSDLCAGTSAERP